ncbi:protelomerase family protein [Microcoleus sp. T3_A4]|uniref:protelomerase family protein n=1 Tax=Microcoleus sp. T3_A4 TaxID=2818968 RepID=UPI002FD768E7
MASKQNKADAQAFYNRVITLQSKTEVHQAVNELLDGFKEREIAGELKVGTISGNLTDYKQHFKKKEHENPELNEPVMIDGKSCLQHIAYNLIDLDKEQKAKLKAERAKSSQKKQGFEDDGELKDTTNIPKTDILDIIKQSLECLTSENPATIACGVINLTGLRAAEQGMPRHEHKEAGIIEHKMIVLDEYVIGFCGVVKKRGADDALAFYARPTLAPAQLIVDAQEKYLQFTKVQDISTDTQKYKETFYQNVNNEYKKRFGKTLSTLKAFDSEGNLIEKEVDGTPHKGRSFYACALRAVLKLNGFGNAACIKVIQKSLAHDNEGETMKYLGSFDESLFINPPNYIEVSTNLNDFGKMINTPVIPVKEAVKSFNLENFQDGLEAEESMQLVKFLRSGMSQTQAILELFKMVRNQKPATKTAEKTDTPEVKEKPRSVSVKEIVEGIMHYNRQATDGDIKKIVVPSNGIINEIAKLRHHGKTIAPLTIKNHFLKFNDVLDEELKDLGIVEGMGGSHNNIHRGKLGELAAKIMEYIEPG